MRVKRQSAKTRRFVNRNRNNPTIPHAEDALEERSNSPNIINPIQYSSSSESEESFRPPRNYHISSSQVAGPSHAGPVIVGNPPAFEHHPYNSDCETQVYSPLLPSHPYNSDSDTQVYSPVTEPVYLNRHIGMSSAIDSYPNSWIDTALKFDRIMSEIRWNSCTTCCQKFPDLFLKRITHEGGSENSCRLCTNKRSEGLFTSGNEMDPGPIPEVLQDLTPIEEMLIAKIHPVVCFYRIRGQQMSYSGHVIHFKQDIVNLYSKLPIDPSFSQAIAIISRTTPSGVANLRVRSGKIRNALLYLKHNHQYYHDIIIDEDVLNSLPIDGDINVPVLECSQEEQPEQEDLDNIIYECNYPSIPQLDQAAAISAALGSDLEWPLMQNMPISEFTTDGYLTQAFPTLFPKGTAALRQPRAKKIDYLLYFQYLMRYHDGRFARHPRFRFVAFDSIMRWQALKQGNLFIQRNAFANVNAEDLRVMLEENPNLLSKVMFNVGKLRASQSFWSQRCGELLDMVQQIGTPTIFFTLSAADYHWPDLFRLLSPDNDSNLLSERERIELMHKNPLITSWFFRRRAETFIDKVLKKIYPVNDLWYRYEWQWRGSPHIHGVLWIDGAPDVSKLDDISEGSRDRIAQWFANFCSAWNFDSQTQAGSNHPSRYTFTNKMSEETDLNDLLNCLQRHTRCGRHCLRKEKRTGVLKCRYGFPKPVCNNNLLVKENGNWQFQPRRNDDKMARYNPFITQLWRGNTDFSPITSKEAVLNYIARYATKCEQASVVHKRTLRDLVANSADSTMAKSLISKLLIASTAERDFSAQECCHLMMSWPLYHSSRQVVNLVIRDDSWVNLLHSDNQNAAIIQRYIDRPTNFSGLSLYNFAGEVRYSSGAYTMRSKRAIVRIFPRLKLGTTVNDSEKYHKLLATAFLPWRGNPETLIENVSGNTPWLSVCENLPTEVPPDMRLDFPLPDDLFEEEIPIDPLREQRDPAQAISRAAPVEHEIRSLGTREIDEEFNWEENSVSEAEKNAIDSWLETEKQNFHTASRSVNRVTSFSADQLKIIQLCRRQIRGLNQNARLRVKRIMVQGKAGSGKSFIIEQIANEFKLGVGQDSVAILAPTGVAAININGKTIHSYLNIGIEKQHKRLQGESLRKFQLKMQNVKVLIFDEMSMIGLRLLEKISIRLQEGSGSVDEPFGGYIVYFFGDMQQLPPVQDYPWYDESEYSLGSMGKLIADSIQRYFLLTTCHRQAGDDQRDFRVLLDEIAMGRISDTSYSLLMSRRASILNPDVVRSFNEAINIFPKKNMVKNHNENHLRQTGNPVARILAMHNAPQGARAKEDQVHGLANELYLSVGCKVMLRSNLWTEVGLVNGALGMVRQIRYKEGDRPPSLPVVVMVEFENYNGPHYSNRCVPIVPLKRQWKDGEISLTRTQFPLIVAHAITTHKSQGLTLDKAVVDIGDKEMMLGLSYVALSRVKTLQGLMLLHSFEKNRIDNISKCKMMPSRSEFLRKFV
uniref:ATP-dependent DNA helicase n=1 Tax=Tetranychus urticae TaxID=32264 RepID=A0A158P537_TETUR